MTVNLGTWAHETAMTIFAPCLAIPSASYLHTRGYPTVLEARPSSKRAAPERIGCQGGPAPRRTNKHTSATSRRMRRSPAAHARNGTEARKAAVACIGPASKALLGADHEAGDVLQEKERDFALAAELDEVRALLLRFGKTDPVRVVGCLQRPDQRLLKTGCK